MLISNQTGKQKRVFVAMSGGVDSSVAAFLLKKRGYQVIGGFIKGYNVDGCAEKDAQDARRVAGFLGIPFYIFDLEKEYKEKVVEYMIDGYKKGITPNPDVMCNKEIKFGLFFDKTLKMGADCVATGHYVRLRQSDSNNTNPSKHHEQNSNDVRMNSEHSDKFASLNYFSLGEARDKNKDQSYFLWTLTQEQLKYCLFPIGDYLKSEVRKIARKAGLPTAEKKDSQGICFLGQVNIADFLKQRLPLKRGEILTLEGKKIGEHAGAYFYTIGQRHLKISNISAEGGSLSAGRHDASGGKNPRRKAFGFLRGRQKSKSLPLYVAEKDIKTNTLIVAEGSDNPALFKKEVKLAEVNFINPELKAKNSKWEMPVMARVRYRQPLAKAQLIKESVKKFKLAFETPQKFVASGQSAVFYRQNGEMLGGGIIV